MAEITIKLFDADDGSVGCSYEGVEHLHDLSYDTVLSNADSLFIEIFYLILQISGQLDESEDDEDDEDEYEDYSTETVVNKPKLQVIKGGLDKEDSDGN